MKQICTVFRTKVAKFAQMACKRRGSFEPRISRIPRISADGFFIRLILGSSHARGAQSGRAFAKSDAANLNFSHYAKRAQSEQRQFRDGLWRFLAARRIAIANFSHYATRSPNDARYFREALSRSAAALQICDANFSHFATKSQSQWRYFREELSRFAAAPRIGVPDFSHYATQSPSEWWRFREGLSRPGAIRARLGASQSRPWREPTRAHPKASRTPGNANLPIGESRRGSSAPAGRERGFVQRSLPARHSRGMPQAGRRRREWSSCEPTLLFHNPYWKIVSTALLRVPPAAVPRSTRPKTIKSPFFGAAGPPAIV
jgi:hypothetical protein